MPTSHRALTSPSTTAPTSARTSGGCRRGSPHPPVPSPSTVGEGVPFARVSPASAAQRTRVARLYSREMGLRRDRLRLSSCGPHTSLHLRSPPLPQRWERGQGGEG